MTDAKQSIKAAIDSGTLVGETENGINVFKGIPYAKPPVGDLRWMPPQMPDKWEGERQATQYALPCIQPVNPDGKTPNGGGVWGETSEDSLYLNVFAPADAKNAPVMVWFHGGAFFLGAGHLGSYNGSAFAKNGVIIVTVNYRLGTLGYFAHPAITKAAGPNDDLGSYGTMDAIAALQWVQRNIEQFGGDKNNVTAFGQSAGGMLVINLLTLPERTNGLFAKAGVQSGSMLRPGMSLSAAEERGVEIAKKLGLSDADASLEELRTIPAQTFLSDRSTSMGVALEGINDGRFISQPVADVFESGNMVKVPLIIGSNNGEGGFKNARKIAGMMSKHAPSFLYQFAYVPEWQKAERPNGAPHAAEIVYAFDSWKTSVFYTPKVNDTDLGMAKQMNSCWVDFAKANVEVNALKGANGFSWPKYDDKTDQAAVFGVKPSLTKAADLPDGPSREAMRRAAMTMAPN